MNLWSAAPGSGKMPPKGWGQKPSWMPTGGRWHMITPDVCSLRDHFRLLGTRVLQFPILSYTPALTTIQRPVAGSKNCWLGKTMSLELSKATRRREARRGLDVDQFGVVIRGCARFSTWAITHE